jgi:rhodanese-related sulfurtransferase
MIPEITVAEFDEKLKTQDSFIVLDVREPHELGYARLTDSRLDVTPLSRLAREGTKALSDSAQSQDATIYVMCHHGSRSAQVTAWLAQQGRRMFSTCAGESMSMHAKLINRWDSIKESR